MKAENQAIPLFTSGFGLGGEELFKRWAFVELFRRRTLSFSKAGVVLGVEAGV